MDELPPLDDLRLARELRLVGRDDRALRHSASKGDLVRLAPGAYAPKKNWDLRNPTLQYQLRCIGAVTASRTHPILSHVSAAAILGIPRWTGWPKQVHVLATMTAGSRTEGVFTRHATRDAAFGVESIGQARRTSVRRTLVEYCATESFANAVVALDWALASQKHAIDRPMLLNVADVIGLTRGRARLLRALAFASPDSGSPGESYSRAVIHELGFAAPALQENFRDRSGFIGRVDFWWEGARVIGEFDGVVKYVREEFTGGASMQDLILAEKNRENRLRALGPRVVRWDAAALRAPQSLYWQLIDAGLVSSRRPRFR